MQLSILPLDPPLTPEQRRWAKAEAILSNGNDLLNKVLNGALSSQCQRDIDALSGIGVSVPGILAMSNTVNWNDAKGNTDPMLGTMVPGTFDYAMFQQHEPPNLTVGQYVTGATEAVSTLPGSSLWGNIYFNAVYVAKLSVGNAAALLMHELIHTLGPDDTRIQEALFGRNSPKVGDASDNITQEFLKNCFQ